MGYMGSQRSASETGDYLAAYAAGLDPSPGRGRLALPPSRRDRSLGRSPEREEPKARKRPKRMTMADVENAKLDSLKLPPMPKTGSYREAKPGTHLHETWDIMVQDLRSRQMTRTEDPSSISTRLEQNMFTSLYDKFKKRNALGSRFHLFNNLRGSAQLGDRFSFRIILDKVGWNQYINGLGPWLKPPLRKKTLFSDTPDDQMVFEEMFEPGDHDVVKDMLQKWIACRIWNHTNLRGNEQDWNTKRNWDEAYNQLALDYEDLERKYQGNFPVPDWRQRLFKGNQFRQLGAIKSDIIHQRERHHDKFAPPQAPPEDDEKQPELSGGMVPAQGMPVRPVSHATPRRKRKPPPPPASRRARIPRAAGASGGGAPPPREVRRDPKLESRTTPHEPDPAPPQDPVAATVRPTEPYSGEPRSDVLEMLHRARGTGGRAHRALAGEGPLAPGPARPAHVLGFGDPLQDMAARAEAAHRAIPGVGRARAPVRTHNNRLRAEVVRRENYEVLNGVHLLQTDNNVQPVMGAVHIVQPDSFYNDKHFMLDVEGDINEGHKVLVERSKRGPFKKHRGRSTVMDRSAHVTYRKRSGAFEITVRRGVISAELQQLLSKLSMHRMSIHGSRVVLIKGTKRYRLGPLNELDLKYLMQLVDECLQQYGTCGLELTESRAGSGALYKAGVHGARFKSSARKGRGPAVA